MNSRRDRLFVFIQQKLAEADPEQPVDLADDTSLLGSRLLDSLAILQLAEWIETELGEPIADLDSLDIGEQWDSIARILAFVGERIR